MVRIGAPHAAVSLLTLALLSGPASAGDFSLGFGFSTGGWRYVDPRPSYVYYDPAPVVYREYAYEPDVMVVRTAPRVLYRDYCAPPVVYRQRTERVHYRDCSPRVHHRSYPSRTYYRDYAPRVYRSPRIHVSGSFQRGHGASRYYYDPAPRSYRSPRHAAPCPPRHGGGFRVRR